MNYLCLVYFEPDALAGLSPGEHAELARESLGYDLDLRDRGHFIAAAALKPTHAAATVRRRGGEFSITDGPFAETREILGGFIYIEARDLNEALRIAGDIPMARYGSIEVRPVQSFSPAGERL
jgi:hypothetical protein